MGRRLVGRHRPVGAGGISLLFAWVSGVVAVTIAVDHHEVRLASVACSPAKVEDGSLWSLFSCGLAVQRPVLISVVTFAALGVATIALCGAGVTVMSALIGHVGSTVLAYALLATYRLADPHAFGSLLTRPDYGVSAISAAWLGALAVTGWTARNADRRGRAAVVLAVCVVAVFAYMLRRTATILDSDHVFAFVIGVGVAGTRVRILLSLSQRRAHHAAV